MGDHPCGADVIVMGAGHNGLTATAYLAKVGLGGWCRTGLVGKWYLLLRLSLLRRVRSVDAPAGWTESSGLFRNLLCGRVLGLCGRTQPHRRRW
jgi:hypothetical protein